ncbi:MAG: DUF2335 domain-containing protein [Candidatus Omnitrophota bacterium]
MEEKINLAEKTETAPTPKIEEPPFVQTSTSEEDLTAGKDSKQTVELSVTKSLEFHSGPLPPPAFLKQYNEIIPDGALRILVMAEKQQDHRLGIENAVVQSDIRRSDRGLVFGFILCLVLALGGILLIAKGKSVSGLIVLFSQMATIAGIFVYSHKTRKEERIEKQKESVNPSNKRNEDEKK